MASTRAQRVGEAIHKEISALLVKGLKDPRIGFVTITAVQVNSDLSLAKIYFTVMGEEKARLDSAAGLKSAVPFLRREVGKLRPCHHRRPQKEGHHQTPAHLAGHQTLSQSVPAQFSLPAVWFWMRAAHHLADR